MHSSVNVGVMLLLLSSVHSAPTPAPTPAPSHIPTSLPTFQPTRVPTSLPSLSPTLTVAPTLTPAPTTPVARPSPRPTTAEPTYSPTLSPTKTFEMVSQRIQIALSFLVLLIFYGIHSCTRPSDLATRGLDPKLFKIREFRVEKRWGCKYCGYLKNVASSSMCMQCGTNQLGEQQIMPAATSRGIAAERWTVRTRVIEYEEEGPSDGRTVMYWSRDEWPFKLSNHLSEVPTSLALAEIGFVATINTPPKRDRRPGSDKWGTVRYTNTPTQFELHGKHLSWCPAHLGINVPANVSSELISELSATRLCFFPEKVAWFYEQIHRLQVEAMMDEVPVEFATAYPNSVLRDSLTLLNKVSPLQVLKGKYKIQYVAARSHTRINSVAGDLNQEWLQALFGQISDPNCGILLPCDDGSLEINGHMPMPKHEDDPPDAAVLSYFYALGRALAMAIISRTFVSANFSPALCKLLLGRPCQFLDLLSSNQKLFQDLLKLMMLPQDAIFNLNIKMPHTSAPSQSKEGNGMTTAGTEDMGIEGGEGGNSNWPGRFTKRGEYVDVHNRLEYVYRKTEHQLFGRFKPQFAALRMALFEVIPIELLSVFDHSEFLMLLNGNIPESELAPSAKVFV